MATTSTATTNAVTSIDHLSNEELIYIVQYLKFADIVLSVILVNKRLSALRSCRHLLYSLKNIPLFHRHSYDLMMKYSEHCIRTNTTGSFIYSDIGRLVWFAMSELGHDQALEEPAQSESAVSAVIRQLRKLHHLEIHFLSSAESSLFVQGLPKQKHLEKLRISASRDSTEARENRLVRRFFTHNICTNSLCLLREVEIDHLFINAEFLEKMSEMRRLEVFKFREAIIDEELYEQGFIALLRKTFANWRCIKKLEIFEISPDSDICSFLHNEQFHALLEVLLSLKTLASLRVALVPIGNDDASIGRFLPYFQQCKTLQELYLSVTSGNYGLVEKIVETVKQTTGRGFQKFGLEFGNDDGYFFAHESSADAKVPKFVVDCMKMTSDTFVIVLPSLPYDFGPNQPAIKPLSYFIDFATAVSAEKSDINLECLQIQLVCFAILTEDNTIGEFAKYASLLHAVASMTKIKWIHGDEVYEEEECGHIDRTLAENGFVVSVGNEDQTMDCTVMHSNPKSNDK